MSSQERFTGISTSLAERDPTQVGVHDSVQVNLSVPSTQIFYESRTFQNTRVRLLSFLGSLRMQ